MRQFKKSFRRVLIAMTVFVTVFVVTGLLVYVFPSAGDTEGADLIYIIGPPTSVRIAAAETLREQGVADQILVSVSPPSNGFLSAENLPICREQYVTCEVPDPLKTRGEAAMLTDYAKTHTVHKTVILTFTPQVMRARFIFAKCYKGDFSVVAVDEPLRLRDWVYQYLYQTAGFLKAFVKPCPQ